MKTSTVAEALARQIASTQALFEAGGPAAAHPLTTAVRESLAVQLDLATALVEDAHAREAAAEAARQPAADPRTMSPEVFGHAPAPGVVPFPTRMLSKRPPFERPGRQGEEPTGRGIVPATEHASPGIPHDASPGIPHEAPATDEGAQASHGDTHTAAETPSAPISNT